MDKVISFIIPSYNVESYLKTALDSFLSLEVLEQIQVIVVDDGSGDRTPEIAQEYVSRYPESFYLLQKENGGHGSAINEGSRIAKGKYIKVIDADDWIVTENLKEFVRQLSCCQADVVLTPFHMVDMTTGKREIRCMYLDDYERFYTLDDVMKNWKSFDRCMTFHGITYNREFYQKYRHELPEKIFYEDQEYASIPCCHAAQIKAINLFLYQYLVGNGNQSVASHNQLKRIGHIRQVALGMLKYLVRHPELSEGGQAYLQQKIEGVVLSFYTTANLVNPNKAQGLKWSRKLNQVIKSKAPAFYRRIQKKYLLYYVMNRCRLNMTTYEKLLQSKAYNYFRKNHKREVES